MGAVVFLTGEHPHIEGGILHWYLNPSVRLAINFVHTQFDDPVATGYAFTEDTFENSEDVLISRFQLDF